MIQIGIATHEDIPALLVAGVQLQKLSPFPVAHTVEQGRQYFLDIINSHYATILTAYEHDTLVGFMVLEISTHPFLSTFPLVRAWATWVRSTHRNGTVVRKFIREAKRIGKSVGAKGLYINSLKSGRGKILYRENGYLMEI